MTPLLKKLLDVAHGTENDDDKTETTKNPCFSNKTRIFIFEFIIFYCACTLFVHCSFYNNVPCLFW